MGKALDANDAPQWMTLESVANVRALVRPVVDAQAVLADVERPPMLGYALQRQRDGIGAGLPERERRAAQLAWFNGLPESRRLALASAQTYHLRTYRAWIAASVERLTVDGEDFGTPLEMLDAVGDVDTAVDLLVELGEVSKEFSTLGKAGPLCSARLCGAPTELRGVGPASDAPPPRDDFEATAAAPSSKDCEGSPAIATGPTSSDATTEGD